MFDPGGKSRTMLRSDGACHRQHISTVEPQAYCSVNKAKQDNLTGKCNDLASGTGNKFLRSWRPDKSRFAFPTHLLSDFLPCKRFLLAKFRMSLVCPNVNRNCAAPKISAKNYMSGKMRFVLSHVSTNRGHRVIGKLLGRNPNACPPCAYKCISTGTPAFFNPM